VVGGNKMNAKNRYKHFLTRVFKKIGHSGTLLFEQDIINSRINEQHKWLEWQDVQINKFTRAAVLGEPIEVTDDYGKTYTSLLELSQEAQRRIEIIRRLRPKE